MKCGDVLEASGQSSGAAMLRPRPSLSWCTSEQSEQLPERLSLVIGSILGALAFLLLAAITVLAVVFQR